APSNSGRNGHVEQRACADARAIVALAQRSHHRVAIHDGFYSESLTNSAHQIKIGPTFNVRRANHALLPEIDRPSKSNAARANRVSAGPRHRDAFNLIHHPARTAGAVGCATASLYQNVVLKEPKR